MARTLGRGGSLLDPYDSGFPRYASDALHQMWREQSQQSWWIRFDGSGIPSGLAACESAE
jgi:hypothetical protein